MTKPKDQLESTVFVIFGGAGDLTWRRLVPVMAYQRWEPIKGTNSLTLPARQNGIADAREDLSTHIPGESMIEVNSWAADQQIEVL